MGVRERCPVRDLRCPTTNDTPGRCDSLGSHGGGRHGEGRRCSQTGVWQGETMVPQNGLSSHGNWVGSCYGCQCWVGVRFGKFTFLC